VLLVAVVVLPAVVLAACVSKDRYDSAVTDARTANAALAAALDRAKSEQDEVTKLQEEMRARDEKLSTLSSTDHDLQGQLDGATAINAKLRGELEHLGKNVDGMLAEKGTLSKALDDARSRLEQLRRAQAAAEARADLFQQLVQKFRGLVDGGQLRVTTRNGRLVLQLPEDVLFDSGQAALRPAGKDALAQVAQVLATVPGREFQVAGHTDNVPIQTSHFASNWDLSAARAVEVVRLLVVRGVDPKALSAAGYGEFDPVASNDTADGRARNRRIEITLQPNLEELVAAPEIK
jgi:chemotaxis protein MotB